MTYKYSLVLFLTFFLFHNIASANWLSDADHWVHHEYNEARKKAHDLENKAKHEAEELAKSAKYIAKVVNDEMIREAKLMDRLVNEAIKEFKNLTLNKLDGACKKATGELTGPLEKINDRIEKEIRGNLPSLKSFGLSDVDNLSFLVMDNCKIESMRGFNCGIFPYVKNIVNAILEGTADGKRFSKEIAKQYKSNACKSFQLEDKAVCAITMAALNEGQKGTACMVNIINHIAKKSSSDKKTMSSTQKKELQKQICYGIGSAGFGFAADAALGEMIPDQALTAKRVFNVAKKLRLLLNVEYHASSLSIDDKKLCQAGIKKGIAKGIVPTGGFEFLKPNQNPGKYLNLISRKSNPLCLDLETTGNKIGLNACHGHLDQRWNFNHRKVDKEYFTITSNYNKHCITLVNKGGHYKVAKCDNNLAEQRFKITKLGELQSKHTNQCLTLKGDKNLVVDAQCKKSISVDEKLFYYQPHLSFVKGYPQSPGSHRQIYINPRSPMCMDYDVNLDRRIITYHCTATAVKQKWSFISAHMSKDNKEYFRIKNDQNGQCITSQGIDKNVKLRACDGNYHQQFYRIHNGKFKNLHTGLCLNSISLKNRSRISEVLCADKDYPKHDPRSKDGKHTQQLRTTAQQWSLLPRN